MGSICSGYLVSYTSYFGNLCTSQTDVSENRILIVYIAIIAFLKNGAGVPLNLFVTHMIGGDNDTYRLKCPLR